MLNRTPIAAEARPALPDFTPVPRKYRHDGWTPERQRAFIAALADTGSVSRAAAMVNMAQRNCYTLRRAAGAESFRRAWEAALDFGVARLKDIAFERAVEGYQVPVFVGGKLMGFRRKYNDALLMFCLRHYGQDGSGRRTTVNYFSTRASAGAAVAGAPDGVRPTGVSTALDTNGSGDGATGDRLVAGSVAEASTTTVRTVIHGDGAGRDAMAAQDAAAGAVEGFAGVELDAQAMAEIDAALHALAARRRAIEGAVAAGGAERIAAEADDEATGLVRLGDRDSPYWGALEMTEGLADLEPPARFGGEAEWVQAGAEMPEGYREWIEAAEARGEAVPVLPVAAEPEPGADGVAEVRKRPPRRRGADREAGAVRRGGESRR